MPSGKRNRTSSRSTCATLGVVGSIGCSELIQVTMIEAIERLVQDRFQIGDVDDHARDRIERAADAQPAAVVIAAHPIIDLARRRKFKAFECVKLHDSSLRN